MGQLISIYNHPNVNTKNLSEEERELMQDIWHNEDEINKINGVELFNMELFEYELEERRLG